MTTYRKYKSFNTKCTSSLEKKKDLLLHTHIDTVVRSINYKEEEISSVPARTKIFGIS